MDYVVNIASPILTTGQSFKVYYKLLPSGPVSMVATYTSNTFTLTGLAAGDYEIHIVFNNGVEDCPEEVGYFTVAEVPDCWVFTPVFTYESGIWFIRINWVGTTLPACGYKFNWVQGSASGTRVYAGGGVPLDIIVPNNTPVRLTIIADDCTSERECYDEDVIWGGGCIPYVITGTHLIPPDQGSNYWQITVDYNQSTPLTTSSTITAVQSSVVTGFTPATFSLTYSPALSPTTSFSFKIFVAPGSYTGTQPTFAGTLTDACGQSHSWSV